MEPRLNILLTHRQAERPRVPAPRYADEPQPWYQMLSHLLSPLGVKTYEATTGPEALQLIEEHPIHLAVLDTRLSDTDRLGVLRLVQRICDRATQPDYAQPTPPQGPRQTYSVQIRFDSGPAPQGEHIEVRFESHAQPARLPVAPTVILLTPTRDDQLLPEALKFNAFSVLQEPVDVNVLLDVMARAMRRFHHNQWPQ